MGILDSIKNQVKNSGSGKAAFIWFKSGAKVRIRFLADMEDGMVVKFHDHFARGVNVPCQEIFGRECPYCEDEELLSRDQYMWPVYDYDQNKVRILLSKASGVSPIPALAGMYETYGTLKDRDYVVTKNGQGMGSTIAVVPMDKAKFRNEKAKPFSEKKMIELLDKAYPSDADNDDEEEDERPAKGKKPAKSDKKKKKPEPEEEEGYEDMSARELYDLCVERDIACKERKPAEYYIDKLEAADEEDEDEDDEDWE